MLIEGPPGAGKGTLSKRAAAAFNLVTIASGDLLRQEIEARTPVGHDVAALMAAGALVPDTVVADLILARLADMADAHWMLDGFPRTVAQSRMLDAYLAQIRQPLDLVINLVVPESIILARIMDRWIHPASGRTYNLNFNPPARPGVDDVTGEPLVKRPDDNVDAFRQRLEVYHRHAEPLLEHYRERGVLRTIRGNTSAELFPKLLMLLEEARPDAQLDTR
ncbi:adenylate kinase [Caulochytrium protostelioides]|uniref:Adenylate kinase n=1 Tax=Caulochytrium protostelioides TaxID=1555241 RepID=A0A4P9WZP3_9FUNG|nr:adenylate kinase [Caulochytrium protostelioides]